MKPNNAGNEKGTSAYRSDEPKRSGTVRRGDIFYADLSPVVGSEQGGLRPVLIIQNDVGNRYSPTVIAAAITSRLGKAKLPTHIDAPRAADGSMGLQKDSVILLEQIRTLDKRRLREKMGRLDEATMRQVDTAISVSFGLAPQTGGAGSGNPVPSAHGTVSGAAAGVARGAEAAITPAGLEPEREGEDKGKESLQ